jgi:hypothetical protein
MTRTFKREQMHATMATLSREKIFKKNRELLLNKNANGIEASLKKGNYPDLIAELEAENQLEF